VVQRQTRWGEKIVGGWCSFEVSSKVRDERTVRHVESLERVQFPDKLLVDGRVRRPVKAGGFFETETETLAQKNRVRWEERR
jgi:hypothetical protein